MSVIINASTSSGLVQTADTSGTLELQSNGTTQLTVSSTGTYGQLKSGTSVSASGTSVDFTGIPSWVKRITLMFSGVSTNGSSNLLVKIGSSGGIESTGYLGTSFSAAGSAIGVTAPNTSGFLLTINNAGSLYNGLLQISLLGSNLWCFSGTLASSSDARMAVGGGSKTISDTLTQVRITTVNGTDTFDAGSINILYEG